MDAAAPDNSYKKFCSKGDQINRLVLKGIGSREGFLPGDITTCLCDVWNEWRREWMVLEGEEVIAGVESLLVRGEGSGAIPCRHRPLKRGSSPPGGHGRWRTCEYTGVRGLEGPRQVDSAWQCVEPTQRAHGYIFRNFCESVIKPLAV